MGGPGPLATPPAAPDKPRLHWATVRRAPASLDQGRRPRRPAGNGKSLLGNPAVALQAVAKDRAGRFQQQLQPLRKGRRKGAELCAVVNK